MPKVNLDALIPREDFEIKADTSVAASRLPALSINNLQQSQFFYSFLRKPDFQRETNEWDEKKICDFVVSFVEGDLIPAVILWQSKGEYIFVIDGAHRLSALIAWVNDDYGDREISKRFYDSVIPDDQLEAAEKTRSLIRRNVGHFLDYDMARTQPQKVSPEELQRARTMAASTIQVQYVPGDSTKVEQSFFNINQRAVPIDPTELRVLKARKKPNGIAARAIMRGAKGHNYWSAFLPETQQQIQQIAEEIHKILFDPQVENPIKTLDLPIGGKVYSAQALGLVLDFVNIVNQPPPIQKLDDDKDGSMTIAYLDKCLDIARRISSKHPGSLGLHPIVYFYSLNGRHKPASFHAITALMLDFELHNSWGKFTKVRSRFESLLLENDYLIQQIVRQKRSAKASYESIKDFYLKCIAQLSQSEEMTTEAVIEAVTNDPEYKYLTLAPEQSFDSESKSFSRETKSATFINQALNGALRCSICNGYLHKNSISIDHKTRKRDGGTGSADNAQLSHFYCNSTIKN